MCVKTGLMDHVLLFFVMRNCFAYLILRDPQLSALIVLHNSYIRYIFLLQYVCSDHQLIVVWHNMVDAVLMVRKKCISLRLEQRQILQ